MASLDLPRLLTPREVAERLQVAVGTLAVWRCTKRYPLTFIQVGRAVRYREADVLAFIEKRSVRP